MKCQDRFSANQQPIVPLNPVALREVPTNGVTIVSTLDLPKKSSPNEITLFGI